MNTWLHKATHIDRKKVRACSHITSAKIRGSWTPPRQQWSAFGLPPLPPPAADVICERPLMFDSFEIRQNVIWIHFSLLWILTGGSVQSRFHSWAKYSWERLFCSQCTHAQTVFETRHNIKVWHHGNNSRQVSPKKMAIPKIFGCGFPSQVPKLIYHRNCENDTDDRVWNWIDRY